MGRFRIISREGYSILKRRKLDFLYRMSENEWRGTLSKAEGFILIKYKLSLVSIDIQKREMNLGESIKPVLINKNKPFNIFDCCEFFEWEYDSENIMD